jgi:hypothetical protein
MGFSRSRTPRELASDACADGQHELWGRNPRGLQFKTIEADINDLASGWILMPSYLPRSGGGRPIQQPVFLVEKAIQLTSSLKRSP